MLQKCPLMNKFVRYLNEVVKRSKALTLFKNFRDKRGYIYSRLGLCNIYALNFYYICCILSRMYLT